MKNRLLHLLAKEVRLLRRDKKGLVSLFFFTALVAIILYFGLEYFDIERRLLLPNIVWLATLFGGTLQLNRTFDYERDESVMEGLSLIPDTAGIIYLSKFLVNTAILALLMGFSAFFSAILFNYSGGFGFLVPVFLGALSMSAIGTTFSSMVMTHHKRDIILPVLFYPLMAPVVISVIKAADPQTVNSLQWMKIIGAFAVIYITVSYLIFETLLED